MLHFAPSSAPAISHLGTLEVPSDVANSSSQHTSTTHWIASKPFPPHSWKPWGTQTWLNSFWSFLNQQLRGGYPGPTKLVLFTRGKCSQNGLIGSNGNKEDTGNRESEPRKNGNGKLFGKGKTWWKRTCRFLGRQKPDGNGTCQTGRNRTAGKGKNQNGKEKYQTRGVKAGLISIFSIYRYLFKKWIK